MDPATLTNTILFCGAKKNVFTLCPCDTGTVTSLKRSSGLLFKAGGDGLLC